MANVVPLKRVGDAKKEQGMKQMQSGFSSAAIPGFEAPTFRQVPPTLSNPPPTQYPPLNNPPVSNPPPTNQFAQVNPWNNPTVAAR